jgi:hypothetical protein
MLAEQLAIRNQPLNETSALLTGSQVQMPQFGSVPGVQVANTDTSSGYGLQYQRAKLGLPGPSRHQQCQHLALRPAYVLLWPSTAAAAIIA